MAVSVALGTWIVSSATSTVQVWAADGTITASEPLEGNVIAVDVPPSLADLYISADEVPDCVIDRTVGSGELIAESACVEDVTIRSMTVDVAGALPANLEEGSIVDLWLSPEDGQPAILIASELTVREVVEPEGFVGSSGRSVELLVSDERVGDILSALNTGGSVSIVMVP